MAEQRDGVRLRRLGIANAVPTRWPNTARIQIAGGLRACCCPVARIAGLVRVRCEFDGRDCMTVFGPFLDYNADNYRYVK